MKKLTALILALTLVLALNIPALATVTGIIQSPYPDVTITQDGDTLTFMGDNGLYIRMTGFVSYEDVDMSGREKDRVYHLRSKSEIFYGNTNVSLEGANLDTYNGYAQKWYSDSWVYESAGMGDYQECPAGSESNLLIGRTFNKNGEWRHYTESSITLFDWINWGGVCVNVAKDDGRISLTDKTIDGISFDDYVNGVRPQPADKTAYASTQPVEIDGKPVTLQAYALKDANGNQTNYVKLRDVAYVLNGTEAQFNVGWDGNVNIITGESYASNGGEMSTPFSGDRAYTVPTSVTNVDGVAANLSAISLTDDNGGGYTYYKLRDLGSALGFNVGWNAQRGIFIETDKPYTDAD